MRKFFLIGIASFFVCSPLTVLAQAPKDAFEVSSYFQTKEYLLSLDEAMRLALENNFDIQLARYDFEIAATYPLEAESVYDTFLAAQIQYHRDKSQQASAFSGSKTTANDYHIALSRQLPSGTTLRLDQQNTRVSTDSPYVSLSPSYDSALGLTLAQDLGRNFFGMQTRGRIKLAHFDADRSRYLSMDKIEQVLADVQVAYWDVVLRQEILRVSQDVANQAKALSATNQEKIKDRLIEQPEFLASQVNYQQKKADVAIARNNLLTAKNILKLHLNIVDNNAEIVPSQTLEITDIEQDLEASLARAFANRRDYQDALNQIKRQGIHLSMKENNIWPEINLRASFFRNGLGDRFSQSLKNITREDHPDFLASVNISFSLENTMSRAQLKRAQYEKAQALLALKFLERRIMIEIVDQVRTSNILREQARNQNEIASLEERKYQELQKIFNHGRSDIDTLIRYQKEASLARQQAVLAVYQYQVSLIQLRMREGVLLLAYESQER